MHQSSRSTFVVGPIVQIRAAHPPNAKPYLPPCVLCIQLGTDPQIVIAVHGTFQRHSSPCSMVCELISSQAHHDPLLMFRDSCPVARRMGDLRLDCGSHSGMICASFSISSFGPQHCQLSETAARRRRDAGLELGEPKPRTRRSGTRGCGWVVP
jgi:hypothetical protein